MISLILFDVDYTLVKNIQQHQAAFKFAINEVFGFEPDIQSNRLLGRTDQGIIELFLSDQGVEGSESQIAKVKKLMEEYYSAHVHEEKLIILPGVVELLTKLSERKFVLGLVTGNLKKIAQAKLSHANLWKFFSIGGFGDQQAERSLLVESAVAEAIELKGEIDQVFVVGDTVRDIQAAQKARVSKPKITIGVATGVCPVDELKAAKADWVLPNLQDAEAFLSIVTQENHENL